MRFVISSGHGALVPGAVGFIEEVAEARRVVPRVTALLRERGHEVVEFHDDTSTTQSENLETIVDFHNSAFDHDLDISVHFNAATGEAMGCEVLYVTQENLATRLSAAISAAGELKNRGAKYRSDLFFLNQTEAPAVLLEVAFVDSATDSDNYLKNFEAICQAIANVAPDLGDDNIDRPDPPDLPPIEAPPFDALFRATGACSSFGGPSDMGVQPDEGLAIFSDYSQAVHLFYNDQPPGTTGLARRLNPATYYLACRWDYSVTPKTMLANKSRQALVIAGGREFLAWPADWGPNENTGRVADLSPGLMAALQITTDDTVSVIYPAPPANDSRVS